MPSARYPELVATPVAESSFVIADSGSVALP